MARKPKRPPSRPSATSTHPGQALIWRWMGEMHEWGGKVRADIVKLEQEVDNLRVDCCHLPRATWGKPGRKLGDPGDPPPPPPPPRPKNF